MATGKKRHSKTAPDPLAVLAGVMSRTQQMLSGIAQRITTLEVAAKAQMQGPQARYFIVRIRRAGLLFASWEQRGNRVRWVADPTRATGFAQYSSAASVLGGLKSRAGEDLTILRVVT